MPLAPAQRAPAGLYDVALELHRARCPFAVATVLDTTHSTPVKAGAKAIIARSGRIFGTVGGGVVEAEAIHQAKQVLRTGKPTVFDFDLHGREASEVSPICGGSMRILVAPGSSAGPRHYQRAVRALARRERGLWITTLQTRRVLTVQSSFLLERDFGPQSPVTEPTGRQCLIQGQPQLVHQTTRFGTRTVFIEPLQPNPILLIIGGGHVSQALAAQASPVGFDIVVFEDRSEFADPALFPPGTQTFCGKLPDLLAQFPMDPDTFIVIVTRDHQHDALALRHCIRRPVAYLGMIGSRRKIPLLRREFLKCGWSTADEFRRVYAPIGLDLGAITVPEIAASIVGQLIAVRRKGSAPRLAGK